MDPLISVVVPIYNIDRYVGACVESLISQTYKKLEIILVDDGSTDRSPDLCDLYAKKDKRIKVVHKPNGGLVSARKAGLAVSTGVYAGYVDGDDWVEPTFYEALCEAMEKSSADLAVAGQSKDLFDSRSAVTSYIPEGSYKGESLDRLKSNMLSYGEFFRIGITTYVWNKLFRRELLIKHQNAVPDNITIGEDAAVVYPYLMECGSVRIIDNFDYHYRQREDSMLKKSASFSKEAVGLRSLYLHLSSFAGKYPLSYRLKEQVDDFLLGICIMRSGGTVSDFENGFAPFGTDFKNKRCVIWSAGTFGQQLVYRIKESGYCEITGWIDPDYREYRRCCLDVDPVDDIDDMEYDYVLIASVNSVSALSVKKAFVWRGIPEDKILTVNCPKEKRGAAVKRYLDL